MADTSQSTHPTPDVPPRSPDRGGNRGMEAVQNGSSGNGANIMRDGTQATNSSPTAKKELPEFPKLPAAPPSHHFGHGFSGRTKVPKAQDYKEIEKSHEQQSAEYNRIVNERARIMQERGSTDSGSKSNATSNATPTSPTSNVHNDVKSGKNSKKSENPHGAPTEKQRMMDQMNANQMKPTDRIKNADKGERRVRDPVTGQAIIVKDADPKDFDPEHTRVMGSDILYHQFPPPAPIAMTGVSKKIRQLQYAAAGGVGLLWFFVAFGSGIWKFLFRTGYCIGFMVVLVSILNIAERQFSKEIQNIRYDQHRSRGEAFSPPFPESVEWLNGLVKLVWGLIDPSFFIPIADMVEDILQQSLPGFVDAVRITDVGQGSNPLRITSIRALPDQPGDKGYPKKDWIDQGENKPLKDTGGKEIDEDEAGDYYNFEVAFAYSALPGQGASQRAKNIHMLVEFFLGAFDWFHIPVPIWIQIEQIFGVVRLRIQFIPEPPFVRNLTFALCGVPDVEVSAIPMAKKLPNVLDLPFISMFVKQGIAAGTAELSVPKSMTLNLKEMLSGGGLGDVRAKGVFVISIHYCEGLGAQDKNGFSDPYIVLAYAKYGRPLYSTRIITEDLNPVFEETAFLMLTEDEVRAEEDVCAMLWDSDKVGADDLVGRVQIPVAELMVHPNKMIRREDKLAGFDDANEMPGKLVWSIGYFEKAPLVKEFERLPTVEEAKADQGLPTPASKEMLPNDAAPLPARDSLPPPPADPMKTRPDPRWPSGVLSIVLHMVNNLERQQLEGKSGDDREGEAGQDTDDPSEATENLPSGYGEFIVNDTMVFKTRVKQYTMNPYFEAGTEVFIRDFTTTDLRIVIRDSRLRENDPIMGIVCLNLMEVFSESSSVTMTYPIEEGVGFGKANITLSFRGVQTTLPDNLRGWDAGTLTVSQVRLTDTSKGDDFEAREMNLTVSTNEATETMKKKNAEQSGSEIIWDAEPLHLPVYSRYQGHVWFEFGKGGLGKLLGKGGPEAIAVLWLQDLTDMVDGEVEIPVIKGERMDTLKANVINDQTLKHHKFSVVGTLRVRMEFSPGLDFHHEELRLSQGRRHALEAWMAVDGEAELAARQAQYDDDGHLDAKEKKEMKKLHERQLESHGRGKAQIGAYRSAKWMTKGLVDRLPGKKKTREPTIQTEA